MGGKKLCDLVVVECDVCPRQNGVFFFLVVAGFSFWLPTNEGKSMF